MRTMDARLEAGSLCGAAGLGGDTGLGTTSAAEVGGATLDTGSDRSHRQAKNIITPAMGISVSSAMLRKDDGRCRLGSFRFPRTIILDEFYAAFFAVACVSPKSDSAFCRIRSSRSFLAF